MSKVVEICCGSYYDALQAYHGGAKRIELNSALHLGGLTPSIATLQLVKQHTDLEVICMVRPRGAGFHYVQEDKDVMFLEAKQLLENGADGLAFGFLNEDKTINLEATRKMVSLIHEYGKTAVFHRAVDVCENIHTAMQSLCDLQIDRVLTSGGYGKAVDGIKTLTVLQETYGKQIELLAGCGLHVDNAQYLIDNTGISQVHSSCKDWLRDATSSHGGVDYSYKEANKYDVVCQEKVEELITTIK